MNRLKYLIISSIILLIATYSMIISKALESSSDISTAMSHTVLQGVSIIATITFIIVTIYRFKNAGVNPWWSLAALLPGGVIVVWVWALIAKPIGYKGIDKSGKWWTFFMGTPPKIKNEESL